MGIDSRDSVPKYIKKIYKVVIQSTMMYGFQTRVIIWRMMETLEQINGNVKHSITVRHAILGLKSKSCSNISSLDKADIAGLLSLDITWKRVYPKDKLFHHLTNTGTVLGGGKSEVHVLQSSLDVVKTNYSGRLKLVLSEASLRLFCWC